MESSEQNSPCKTESEDGLSSGVSAQDSYDESDDISDSLFPIGPLAISQNNVNESENGKDA